jgi:hypothetical protein
MVAVKRSALTGSNSPLPAGSQKDNEEYHTSDRGAGRNGVRFPICPSTGPVDPPNRIFEEIVMSMQESPAAVRDERWARIEASAKKALRDVLSTNRELERYYLVMKAGFGKQSRIRRASRVRLDHALADG